MSRKDHRQSNASMRNNRNEMIHGRISSNRSKSIDTARLHRRQKNNMQYTHTDQKSLEDYGYYFENGKLISIEDGKPFEFNVYSNHEDNHRRYHAIGRLVDKYVYDLLENECHLRRVTIPIDARKSEPTGFFFVSDDLTLADDLMIIIHGMGVVRAGQWSRKLIINERLEVGSQIDYIQRARANGYAVIVTNTNLNIDESSKSIFNASRPIRGSSSPEEHACYIWEHFVRQSPARRICIMAHSYGGAVVLELASRFMPEFDRRVFAVALTDSPMPNHTKYFSTNVLRMLQKRTINWIANPSPVDTNLILEDYGRLRSAGHILHEWTSYTAYHSIFKFFGEERQKLERYRP